MSQYRFDMKKACNDCPFMKSSPLAGAPDWLEDVAFGFIRESLAHSCHKTDPGACGFVGGKAKQHCMGLLGMMKNMGVCYSRDAIVAMAQGDLDWSKVPTAGAYRSILELVTAYRDHYSSELSRRKLIGER